MSQQDIGSSQFATPTIPQDDIGPKTVVVDSVTVTVPWYKKIFNRALKDETRWYVAFVLFFVVGLSIANNIKTTQTGFTNAGTNQAIVSFMPATLSFPSTGDIQVWLKTEKPVSSVQVEMSYDPAVVRLAKEIDVAQVAFSKVDALTSVKDANIAGKIVMNLSLDPQRKVTPPVGSIQLATLRFAPVAKGKVTSSVKISSVKVTNADSSVFTVTTQDASLIINQ